MPIAHLHFQSAVLGTGARLAVVLPDPAAAPPGAGHRTLLLLHGYTGDESDWTRQTNVERYASERGLAVVMPAAANSFYADMASGGRYWTFVSEEVPRVARACFPLSASREDNFVAGLSMGGYGALKLAALRRADFAAAASFSAVADLASFARVLSADPRLFEACRPRLDLVFGAGAELEGGPDDLKTMYSADPAGLPRLRMYCGRQDFLVRANRRFRDFLASRGIECDLQEADGGHEWDYWDRTIQLAMDFFLGRS